MAEQRGNLRATLALSQEEARTGTERVLTLPGGRKVTLFIQPGAYSGQEIHLSGQGEPISDGTPGDLVITLTIPSADSPAAHPFVSNASDTETNIIPPTLFPPLPTNSPPSPNIPSTIHTSSSPTVGQPPMTPSHTPSASSHQSSGSQQPYYTPVAPFTTFPQQQPPTPVSHYQSSGSQQPYYIPVAPLTTFPQQQPPTPRHRSPLVITLISLLVLMLLVGSSLVLYTTVYVPYKASSDATATAVTQVTQTAQANATTSAQQTATSVAIGHATATALAQLQNDYTTTTSSAPSLNSPLQAPDLANWDTTPSCTFTGGAYHAKSSQQKTITLCLADNTHFSNFAFQVQMKILKGDGGGIIFRADGNKLQNYLLKIFPNGDYELDYYRDQTGKSAQALASDSSTSLKTGLNQDNTIGVIARGDTMNFYFNGQYVTTVKDSSRTAGQIGVIAYNVTNAAEVAYTQARVWQL